MLKKLLVLAVFCLVCAAPLAAQSKESATSAPKRLFVGGDISTYNPDWGCSNSSAFACWDRHLLGLGALVDLNQVAWKVGVEGEARWFHWGGPGGGLQESSYLVGPRYPVYRNQKFTFYVQGLMGKGRITRPFNLGAGSYFAFAPGGTVEYRVKRNVVIRGGYEYQIWPQFQGLPGLPAKGLTPNGLSLGFTYRL